MTSDRHRSVGQVFSGFLLAFLFFSQFSFPFSFQGTFAWASSSDEDIQKLNLLSSDSSSIQFSDFVITPEKFQKLIWRDFLLNYKSLYSKKNYRVFKNGSVVFYGIDDEVAFSIFFKNQLVKLLGDEVERIISFKIRVSSGDVPMEVIIRDRGDFLKPIKIESLVNMDLPLELTEKGLKSKKIDLIFSKFKHTELTYLIRGDLNSKSQILLQVMSEFNLLFRLHDFRSQWQRELIWLLDRSSVFAGSHRLRIFKTKSDQDLMGSEDFYIDGGLVTPAQYLEAFSNGFSVHSISMQAIVTQFQNGLNEVIEFMGSVSSSKSPH